MSAFVFYGSIAPLCMGGLALVLLLSGWGGLLLLAIQRPPSNQDWIARSLAYKEAAASAQDGHGCCYWLVPTPCLVCARRLCQLHMSGQLSTLV